MCSVSLKSYAVLVVMVLALLAHRIDSTINESPLSGLSFDLSVDQSPFQSQQQQHQLSLSRQQQLHLTSQYFHYSTINECDRIFISSSLNSTYGLVNGTFVGPSFSIPLPKSAQTTLGSSLESNATVSAPEATTPAQHTAQCIYMFIAGQNERVKISFKKFSLRSQSPECENEYVDIYSELKEPDSDLLSTPFGGRYCDEVIPRDRVSLYRTVVISFYTEKLFDGTNINGSCFFSGTYEFVNAAPYTAGTSMPNELCSFTINSETKREGEMFSPTYPGVYPKGINCYYLFKGIKGQRVKIEFMDFDLYYGGSHCPYDFLKIYDGDSISAPIINTYCGQQRQLFVFSSGINLLIQFTTMKRISSDVQNRGFSGYYEFSEKFVNLDFILKNENGEHIRGTECDQKILSRKESNGTIYAPNYPYLYHSNTMCKYYIYGLQDSQNLERINFQFEMLQIPTKDVNECTDAYVRLYTQTQAVDEFDYVFCGETTPPPIVSDGPILLVVFNSGSTQGQGFKAHYWFETDYKVLGTQASPGQCHFSYVSGVHQKNGEFNSPRHPSNYPSSTYCIYSFFGEPGEQVKLVFNRFSLSDSTISSVPGYNEVCNRDWIEIYSLDASGRQHLYGRYCSTTSPGPILSEPGLNQMKVLMNTDDSEVAMGFLAEYHFIRASEMSPDCGGNFTNLENGIIQSPNFPNNYPDQRQICNWFITVRSGSRIMLFFDTFKVEGNPAERGCSGGAVRIWLNLNQKPIELCGEKLNNETRQLISEFNVLRITFFTAQKSVGAQGFSAVWTEVEMPLDLSDHGSRPNSTFGMCPIHSSIISYPSNNELQQTKTSNNLQAPPQPVSSTTFQCRHNGFCISSKLNCNGVHNCGLGDDSDEMNCPKVARLNLIELLGGLAGMTMFAAFTIGVLCLTAILILNWYRRSSNEEKNLNQIIDKTAGQYYFSHSVPEYSNYYQSDQAAPTVGTTPHRLIDIMTVSSSTTTDGGGNGGIVGGTAPSLIKSSKWPSASNSGDSSHHHVVTSSIDQGFIENEVTSSSPIPPPPPPPATRSHLVSRQSSLVNFHFEGAEHVEDSGSMLEDSDGNSSQNHTQSMIGINRSFGGGGPPFRTMSRQSDSRTSTFQAVYPTYYTLGNKASAIQCHPVAQFGCGGQSSNHQLMRRNSPPNTTNDGTVMAPMDSIDSGQLISSTMDDDKNHNSNLNNNNNNGILENDDDDSLMSRCNNDNHELQQRSILGDCDLSSNTNEYHLMLMADGRNGATTDHADTDDSVIMDVTSGCMDSGGPNKTISNLRKFQLTRLTNSSGPLNSKSAGVACPSPSSTSANHQWNRQISGVAGSSSSSYVNYLDARDSSLIID